MIRLADLNDKNGLINLWNEAFGDSIESIEFFLNARFNPGNTLIAEDNGKIISMLFLFEGKVACGDGIFDAYYLYAAATLKAYRGRGIMAEMLKSAKNLAVQRNVDLICLKPADDRLFDYYEKHGYKSVFSIKTVTLHGNFSALCNLSGKDNCADYSEARENVFGQFGRFIWDCNAVKFATEYHKFFGGKIFESRNGYLLYIQNDDVYSVKELCFTLSEFQTLFNNLPGDESAVTTIDLPVDYPFEDENSVIKRNGMALATSEKGRAVYNYKNLYLNLTLD